MQSELLRAIRGPQQHSPEWYALRVYDPLRVERPVVFGASEAAAACNVSPYSSALQLFLEKRGEFSRDVPEPARHRMSMGLRLEPVILDMYEERADCRLERNQPMFLHETLPFMGASPDAVAIGYGGACRWVVDAKSTTHRRIDKGGLDENKFGAESTDQVPVEMVMQAQVLCEVMGVGRVDFAALVDGCEYRTYKVERNEDLIQQIISAEKELYERIIANDPPEPNFQHSGTIKVLHRMFGHNPGTVAQLSEIEYDMWLKYEQLGVSIKMMEEDREEIRAKIMWALGECEIGRFPDAGFEVRRTIVKDSIVTQKDVDDLLAKIGQVKRAGHSRIMRKSLNK